MSKKLTDEEKLLRKKRLAAFKQRYSNMESRSEELLRSAELLALREKVLSLERDIKDVKTQLEQESRNLEEDFKAKKAALLNKFEPTLKEWQCEEKRLRETLFVSKRAIDLQVREEFDDLCIDGKSILHWTQWKGWDDGK